MTETKLSSAGTARHAGELVRFVIVGTSAVATDFIVYFALLAAVPAVRTSVAKAFSFIAGAVLAFVLNRSFVFRADGRSARDQLAPFSALYLVSLGLNGAVNTVLLQFGVMKGTAWFFATGTSTISNFAGMKLFVFRQKK